MPLSEQERKCIELAGKYLTEATGAVWRVQSGQTLDELFPNQPSPEVLVTDGDRVAAVEVKRLTGDSVVNEYWESLQSLSRFLTPSCGGHYRLIPAHGLRLPIGKSLRRLLKQEIENAAPLIAIGERMTLPIPRKALLRFVGHDERGTVFCSHSRSADTVRAAGAYVQGIWQLVDDGQWEHSFLTERRRTEFFAAVLAASERVAIGRGGNLEWYEDWTLEHDDMAQSGVSIASGIVGDLASALHEAVHGMLRKALIKFVARTWGDLHIVVFDGDDSAIPMSPDRIAQAVRDIDPQELKGLDLVLFVAKGQAYPVWADQGATALLPTKNE